MAQKADTVAKRLAELFTGGLGARLSTRLKTLEQELGPAANVVIPDWNAVLPDWVDPTITIFSLNPSSIFDRAVLTAFDKADLDPKNPVPWKLLVTLFAWAHFGKWRSRGRRRRSEPGTAVADLSADDPYELADDPHEEHDFGAFEVDGNKIFFKIDYYDKTLTYYSPDPSDPSVTERVITIMLAEEY